MNAGASDASLEVLKKGDDGDVPIDWDDVPRVIKYTRAGGGAANHAGGDYSRVEVADKIAECARLKWDAYCRSKPWNVKPYGGVIYCELCPL